MNNFFNDFNTWIVGSTINASSGILDNETRFNQTIESLESIKKHDPTAKIIFIDNSVEELTTKQLSQIKVLCDVTDCIELNPFTNFTNTISSKGLGEAFILYRAIMLMKDYTLIGKRIFKLSGRYKLADSFDINEYNDPKYIGKYAFRINVWDVVKNKDENTRMNVVYFETRLISFCHSLVDEYLLLIQQIFNLMITNIGELYCNWEIGHWKLMPHNKVIEMNPIHVEGINAVDGVYRFE